MSCEVKKCSFHEPNSIKHLFFFRVQEVLSLTLDVDLTILLAYTHRIPGNKDECFILRDEKPMFSFYK